MHEACINEAIEDTTDGIYVLTQHASDEPEDVVVVVLKGIKGLVHPKMKILSLTIDSSTVERVSSTKFLGMHITEDLTWTTNTCHSPRRHNSTYISLPAEKRQVSHHPSSHTFIKWAHWECAGPACITVWYGNCSAADRKDTPSGQWNTAAKIIGALSSIHTWTFSLHDAPAKPTASWRTPPPLPSGLFQLLPSGRMVTGAQSPLRQQLKQLFPPGCESPETQITPPPLKPHANPYPLKHGHPPPPSPNTPLTLPHQRKKTVNFFVQFKVCYTQVSGPVQTTCSKTLSSMRTRHFSHTAVCTQSHKRLSNICMFTCSCTTNHLVLFLRQLLDSQYFSLHMYSIYVKQSYSLYFLSFIFSCIG